MQTTVRHSAQYNDDTVMSRGSPSGHQGCQARLSRSLSPSSLLFFFLPSFPLSIAGCYTQHTVGQTSPVHNYAPSGRPLNGVRRVRLPFPPVRDLSEPSALRSFAYRPSYITRHRSVRFPARIYCVGGICYLRAWNAAGKQTKPDADFP